ncbi:MAG TPA: uracil-DNA glycosylase [Bacillota bacterium]
MVLKKTDCLKCKYYYVTWEQKFPNGCKFFGFKSQYRPSLVVWQTTGQKCEAYTIKNAVEKAEETKYYL